MARRPRAKGRQHLDERSALEVRAHTEALVDLLDVIDACYPTERGHISCDNLAAHDTDDVYALLEAHPRWTRHFTPKHASWLNQIEDMFSIVQRRVLARGSFRFTDELRERFHAYMFWHNERARSFTWTYRPKSWRADAPSARQIESRDGRRTCEGRNQGWATYPRPC